ncbi:MAG: dnaE [Desulfomicrobiaceae bacterium]|nr:dnaE [Desulfomicrobiaceae bacterium]
MCLGPPVVFFGMNTFAHLHCHTEYSLLDGAIRLRDLCARAVDYGMEAAAVTDHGNLFAALPFYLEAKKHGIRPIIGCEVYVTGNMHDRSDKNRFHLVLLAQNLVGYHNLVRLVSAGFLEGFYYKPRVDKECLKRHAEGLIALSACIKGEIPWTLTQVGMDAGLEVARQYAAIFPGRLYLELQENGLPEQEEANARLLETAQTLGLPLVATNDCHYLEREDFEAHDALLCIGTGKTVDTPGRLRFSSNTFYFRPPEEMEAAFAHVPEALENAARIADLCQVEFDLGRHHFPAYAVPDGCSMEDEFQRLAREGLEVRLRQLPYAVDPQEYRDRLEHELAVITEKGFAPYFLIVQDFINWAKSQGIPVGPGRGSAAGSLVAYALRITDLDPIRYRLYFERFLNAERASLPDIDVDFCYNRRDEVIRYVTEKYGADRVAQIVAFGTMKAKGVVRDVARVLGIPLKDADRVAKLIPDDLKMTLDKALEQEPELRALVENDPVFAKLFHISRRLEGLARHPSQHAAGIVISREPMVEYLPLHVGKNGEVVTQFDMKKVEMVGLIKFDFLGLKTLTVIHDALRLIAHGGGTPPDLETLPLDDAATYELLCRGETDGVFQLESEGMRRVLRSLKPSCFEDIIALLALYRPGPLESGMVDDFIDRKHGRKPIEYAYPELAPRLHPILEDTYGVILYQEQVMKIASELANYSMGEGDILRRAMGKKNPEEMAKQRSRFLSGARENGISEEAAGWIFDLMEKFAGYGFNKAHSAAYALISYQTAYLKAHFPAEFMAATITSEVSNSDKVLAHVNACRDMGLTILPPDVNQSRYEFTVEDGAVRYGLSGIKGVGEAAVQGMVAERDAHGPFASLLDFCCRVDLRKANKKVLEALIKAGAMDTFGCHRGLLLAAVEPVMAMAQRQAKRKRSGQLSFAAMADASTCRLTGIGADVPIEGEVRILDDTEKLRMEKEALGFYLMGHPLEPYREELRRMDLTPLAACAELGEGTAVRVAVLVTGLKAITTKRGDRMAFAEVEDLSGSGEMVLFSDVFAACREVLAAEEPVLVEAEVGRMETDDNGQVVRVKLVTRDMRPLRAAVAESAQPVRVEVPLADVVDWDGLAQVFSRHTGPAPVVLEVVAPEFVCQLQCGPGVTVAAGPQFWRDIECWRGGQ